MKHLIENFCKGMYDSLTEQQKNQVSYAKLEEVVSKLMTILIRKLFMVILVLILSIPFILKFHIRFEMWLLELCLWIVWIKQTTDWKEFKDLLKRLDTKK